MALDQAVALQVQPPNVDVTKPLLAASEIQKNVAATRNMMSETDRRNYDLMSDQFGRAANDILQQPDGPEKNKRWNYYVDKFQKAGYISDDDAAQWKDKPSNLVLNQAVAHSMAVQQHAEMTGTTEEARARAAAKYREATTQPGETVQYPGVRPGAPTPTNPLISPSLKSNATQGEQPISAAQAPATTLGPGRPTVVQPNTNPANAPGGPFANDPYYQSAPVTPVAPSMPTGPGIVQPGIHPATMAIGKESLAQFEPINAAATGAAKNQADLLTLDAELRGGKVSTDRLSEIKTTVAGYIYGVTGDKELTKSVTGLDLSNQELFNKGATRMGLSYARQTEGAREAVQAIRIALGANPSLLNSEAGNLKVIDTMMRANEYDIERQHGAHAYYQKQLDAGGMGHLHGFEPWFTTQHSPSVFMSKAVPYAMPSNVGEMKPGVTYEFPKKDPQSGKDMVDPKTKQPVMQKGVWDPQRNGMVLVQ